MSWLEEELKTAMKRRPAPEGFAGRVLVRVSADRPPAPFRWQWAAAMAASLTILIGGYGYREAQRRQDEEKARAEVRFALELTQQKLDVVKAHLSRIGLQGKGEI